MPVRPGTGSPMTPDPAGSSGDARLPCAEPHTCFRRPARLCSDDEAFLHRLPARRGRRLSCSLRGKGRGVATGAWGAGSGQRPSAHHLQPVSGVGVEVLRGAAGAGLKAAEVHYPSNHQVRERVALVAKELGLYFKRFDHPNMDDADGRPVSYSWLLAQLAALDACDLIVAAGGRLGGSAGMLLHQAEAKRRPVVPLGHLGGEAALALERQRYRLLDRLGES